MTGIDAEPLRELTVRQLPLLAFLTEHLENPLPLAQRGCIREQGGDVPVRTDPQQQEVQLYLAELLLVLGGGALLAELALDAMHPARPAVEVVEQRLLCHAVVRVVVVRWN